MEREKQSEQYTFGAEEQDILKKLDIVEASVGQNVQEKYQRELISVKYYSEFEIDTKLGPVVLEDVFITADVDSQGKLNYRFSWIKEDENGEQTVEESLNVDENGKAHATGELKEILGEEEIDIEELMQKNDIVQGRLRGTSERAEDREKSIDEELNGKRQEDKEEQEGQEDKDEQTEEKEEQQIQNDLQEEGQDDLEISYYRPIKDNSFDEQIGTNTKKYEEKGIAYSKSQNKFIFIGKNSDGKFEKSEDFEPAKPTYRRVMSIDEKGETLTKEVPHAIMKTKNSKKELSITIGQYGYIEAKTVDVLPCNVRVSREVREEGETSNDRTDIQLNRAIREEGIAGLHEWVHTHDKTNGQMDIGDERQEDVAEEISNDGEHQEENHSKEEEYYIPGTDITWEKFAIDCGYRGEDNPIAHAKETFNKAKENGGDLSNKELAERVIEEKENDYRGDNEKRR